MKSEWRFLIRKLAGEMVYQVYRLKNMNAVDDYDNREYAGDILHNKREAMALAGRQPHRAQRNKFFNVIVSRMRGECNDG